MSAAFQGLAWRKFTIDIGSPCTMSYKTVRGLEYVVETDAEADLLNYLTRIESRCMGRQLARFP